MGFKQNQLTCKYQNRENMCVFILYFCCLTRTMAFIQKYSTFMVDCMITYDAVLCVKIYFFLKRDLL